MTTKKQRWVWTKHRKNLRHMMTHVVSVEGDKDPAMTPEQLKHWLASLRRKAAKDQGWRAAELVCAIVQDNEEVDAVAQRMGLTT